MAKQERAAWLFTASLAALALLLALPAARLSLEWQPPFEVSWLLLAVAFAAAERFPVTIETRREAHALTFSEIPLTIGLIFAQPGQLLLARVVGAALALTFVRRLPAVKIVFNVSVFAVEASTALIVYHLLLGGSAPVDPHGWVAAFVAVGVSHLTSWISVSWVLRLAGAPLTIGSALSVLKVSGTSVLAATAVALGAASALWSDGRSWILLLIIGAALGYFFTSFVRIRERHQALSSLHEFTSALDVETSVEGVLSEMLSGTAQLLKGRRVIAYIPTTDSAACAVFEAGQIKQIALDGDASRKLAVAFNWMGSQLGAQVAAILGLELSDSKPIAARLPVLDGDGVLIVDGRISEHRDFDEEDVQLLETSAGHAGSALRNVQLVEKLRQEAQFRAHQALHDDVTDLPNQRALVETLDEQLTAGVRVVLLTVRTHSLREVNETLGRSVGDEMLRQVAHRLESIAEHSWCARSGTDEFTLVVPGGQDEADGIGQRIVEAFDQPILCDDVALAVTVGIGVALAPLHGTEAEILVRRASLAASRSALDGTTVTTWASDRDPYDPNRLTIAADLRDAIPGGELEVHFQPQLDLKSNTVNGVEALVRWHHPRLGQLRPDQFIAAAEHTGAIDALTLHVLTVSAETGSRWHRMGWELDVAVNLSARNLTNPHFANEVANILEMTGFPATSLTLELTESSVMTEAERAMTTLHELHALGVIISIDDFGTGYSSLAHLRRLPVSEIKIDKSFVLELMTNASDAAIVRSMIELGHNLGLTVVAEGVETVEVRAMLSELRSDRLQGYLLSRPLTSSAFEHWFRERQGTKPGEAQVVTLESRR